MLNDMDAGGNNAREVYEYGHADGGRKMYYDTLREVILDLEEVCKG